jgi:hypothetical protein
LPLAGLAILAATVWMAGCQSTPAGAGESGEQGTETSKSTRRSDTRTTEPASERDEETQMEPLAAHAWEHRPIVVFAPSPDDETLERQMELFEAHRAGLDDRDIVVYRVFEDEKPRGPDDVEPQEVADALRRRFQPTNPFTVILVGKDTTEKLRTDDVLQIEKLFDTIDAMPMRQREMKRED